MSAAGEIIDGSVALLSSSYAPPFADLPGEQSLVDHRDYSLAPAAV